MPQRFLTSVLVFMGFAGVATARDLQVDVEVLHVGGLLAPEELAALLASPQLKIEASYQPTRLIDGVTARRERTMPLGSRLFAISQVQTLSGAELERKGRSLSFRVGEGHAAHASYRLQGLTLRVPIAAGFGRPQPDLEVVLSDEVPSSGATERAFLGRYGTFELGVRVRLRWSDARDAYKQETVFCSDTVEALGNGQYRFRASHRLAGLFQALPTYPPSRPVAGHSHWKLGEPYPEPLTGWQLTSNHLVRTTVAGQVVERLSVDAEQKGPGACRRSRAYGALFAGGQVVALARTVLESDCSPGGDPVSQTVEARWLEDGSLADYVSSSPPNSRTWHAFSAALPAHCRGDGPPPADEVERLKSEVQRLRAAATQPAGR
ncbi:MAG: hypothetical protein ACREUW_11000 [Burkholderiales bacterium]